MAMTCAQNVKLISSKKWLSYDIKHVKNSRKFSRGGPEQKFSYIVASRVRNINLT